MIPALREPETGSSQGPTRRTQALLRRNLGAAISSSAIAAVPEAAVTFRDHAQASLGLRVAGGWSSADIWCNRSTAIQMYSTSSSDCSKIPTFDRIECIYHHKCYSTDVPAYCWNRSKFASSNQFATETLRSRQNRRPLPCWMHCVYRNSWHNQTFLLYAAI
jgi:hypothetical protein